MVYKGIYLPSLSGKLQDERLEIAYQRYAHRQRQKSLMLVNSADILLKAVILLKVTCYITDGDEEMYSNEPGVDKLVTKTCFLVGPDGFANLLIGFSAAAGLNVILGLFSCWQCYANNFLHWGAIVTWLLLLIQGKEDI